MSYPQHTATDNGIIFSLALCQSDDMADKEKNRKKGIQFAVQLCHGPAGSLSA